MYTKLPHDRIKLNVQNAIEEAHEYQRQVLRKTHGISAPELYMSTQSHQRGQWTHEHSEDALSLQDIIQHLHFVVDNTYLHTSNGTIRHQQIGIPMGTNASPEIANLTLYWDEASYVDQLMAKDLREAQKHAFTSRFIDDVLSWGVLPPPPSVYDLEWKETTHPDGSCTFLGAKIRIDTTGSLRIGVFDKAAEWGFHVIRYPSAKSNIPAHQPAGVLTGQLARFR